MRHFTATLACLAAGATAMYFLDPQLGRRRRALVRDKLVAASHSAGDVAQTRSKWAADHAKGVAARAHGRLQDMAQPPDDAQLCERVRAHMGRAVSHPKSIEVEVCDGQVCLRGKVLAHELDGLLEAVSSTPGVQGVDSRLSVHQEAGNVPELQGSGRSGGRGELGSAQGVHMGRS
ncbi:BON domain-containing protein [Aquabacterium sp. A7-Y]|uniref:BON domain-containing protein n=1 Tax=Aquabacterium sp. A7-Y TaxID=1349605 RepID=UPI00223CC8AC|nr:BON domain-containing protein [Aquabacterium sp. A7-Y]MCW7539333.1 BON domain-containing protein [Aquabacterium sp. A7-Y]